MEHRLRRVRVRLVPVVVVIFVLVSSGAFGLEDMVGSSGAGPALLLTGPLAYLVFKPACRPRRD